MLRHPQIKNRKYEQKTNHSTKHGDTQVVFQRALKCEFFFFLVKRATRFLLVVPTRFDVRWQDETLLLHKKTSTTSRNSPRVSKSSDKIFFEVI